MKLIVRYLSMMLFVAVASTHATDMDLLYERIITKKYNMLKKIFRNDFTIAEFYAVNTTSSSAQSQLNRAYITHQSLDPCQTLSEIEKFYPRHQDYVLVVPRCYWSKKYDDEITKTYDKKYSFTYASFSFTNLVPYTYTDNNRIDDWVEAISQGFESKKEDQDRFVQLLRDQEREEDPEKNSFLNIFVSYDRSKRVAKPVGGLSLCIDQGIGWITQCAVAHQHRAKGHGKFLLQRAMSVCHARGVECCIFDNADVEYGPNILDGYGFKPFMENYIYTKKPRPKL